MRGWYKRTFTTEGPWEKGDEGAIDAETEKRDEDGSKPPQ